MKAEDVQTQARRRAEDVLGALNLPLALMSELVREQACAAFDKGEPVFLHGSTADVLYWVVSGLVKVYCATPDGGRVLVRMAGPGDFIGAIDTTELEGRRVQALEAVAMTKTNVAIFTRDRMRTLLKTFDAENLISLIEDVNRMWGAVSRSWITFFSLSVRKRLQSTLEDLALRFGVHESRGILLTIAVSHDELAEMILSSRPMVTRLIGELVEDGFIARQGRHYILLKTAKHNGVR